MKLPPIRTAAFCFGLLSVGAISGIGRWTCEGFQPSVRATASRSTFLRLRLQEHLSHRCRHGESSTGLSSYDHESDADFNDAVVESLRTAPVSRRRALSSFVSVVTAAELLPVQPQRAAAEEATPETVAVPGSDVLAQALRETDYTCLKDLPSVPTGYVRIYFCRHGQTENNRLRKVQGSRVDPPINDNGIIQAVGMGKALANANDIPKKIYHSKLLRARMTAQTAAEQMTTPVSLERLEFLSEIDFGPVAEGQSVSIAKAGMEATATRWAIGDIDYRPSGGGETGREVLERASKALSFLVEEASKSGGCVAAVSHSGYIRMMLGMIRDEPLLEAMQRRVNNGSINVVDVRVDGAMFSPGRRPKLLGGSLSLIPADFDLEYPQCSAVRINETRHLAVL